MQQGDQVYSMQLGQERSEYTALTQDVQYAAMAQGVQYAAVLWHKRPSMRTWLQSRWRRIAYLLQRHILCSKFYDEATGVIESHASLSTGHWCIGLLGSYTANSGLLNLEFSYAKSLLQPLFGWFQPCLKVPLICWYLHFLRFCLQCHETDGMLIKDFIVDTETICVHLKIKINEIHQIYKNQLSKYWNL